MTEIENRIAVARHEADAAQAKVNAVSSKLLGELLQRTYRQAANHLSDPRLTPADSAKLKAHLQKQLSARPRRPIALADRLLSMVVPMMHWPLQHRMMLAGSVALLTVGGIAWSNTPKTIGLGRLPNAPEMRWPDGTVQKLDDTYAVVDQLPGEWLIRVWRPYKGYEAVRVPYDAILAAD